MNWFFLTFLRCQKFGEILQKLAKLIEFTIENREPLMHW
jgi:hypothetical protein